MSLDAALGGMRAIAQWFVWRLEWDGTQGKYLKTPCALDGSVFRIDASKPENWHQHQDAARAIKLLPQTPELRYALGFWMTAEAGYWFLDIDKCGEQPSDFVMQLVNGFPGALVEWSSSRKGLHVIGRGSIPEHRNKPPREVKQLLKPVDLEFYSAGRGIAFGLDGQAQGSADTVCDVSVLCQHYFPPRAVGEPGDGARAEWRGPADDDVLIAKALAAKSSAAVAFGGKASFGQLWRGEVEQNSDHDMSLAAHLAFWTGCDEERIDRLMRRSGLKRDKWNEHRPHGTYLSFTIANACALCTEVYQEPERNRAAAVDAYGYNTTMHADPMGTQITLATPSEVIPAAVVAKVKELLGVVSACGTVEDMHNSVIPAIQAAGIPKVYAEQLVRAINTRLDLWDAKLPVGQLRAILFPPPVAGVLGVEAPLWLQRHCYVKDGDYFYDVENGTRMTHHGFIAEYARLMPLKENGGRENPVEWAFTRWNIRTVHHIEYRPDEGAYFARDGLDFANGYAPSSVPAAATAWSEGGRKGIEAFQRLLYDMSARREEVYLALLQWIAHNVQKPGVKIRWSPVIKGCMGDGKTLISNVIRSAMGFRNVKVTGNSTLTANGGFNDWANGGAVNIIEEIMLVGKIRHALYNAMNEFITNDYININAKGDKTYMLRNVTNHIAFTNHNDALPLPGTDRRWMVVFTPWMTLDAMRSYCELDAQGWADRTDAVDALWRLHADEARAWLLSIPLDGFDGRGSAPVTPEKSRMMASGQDDAEAVAAGIIEDGANGVTVNVLSSNCLSNILRIRGAVEGFDVPRSTTLNHMLTRMGYSKVLKQIKWRGATHTLWIKNGFPEDISGLRLELDRNLQPNLKPSN